MLRYKLHLVAILTFSIGVISPPVLGQQNRSTISGFIYDPEHRPVAQIYVELTNEVNNVLGRVRTDSSGRFFFSGLSSGRFTLRVLPLDRDFESQSEDVEVAGIGVLGRPLADNVQKDIHLKYRKRNNELEQVTGIIFAQPVPEESQIAYKKALSAIEKKDTPTAISELQKALAIFPDYLVALEKLGTLQLAGNNYEEAVQIFKKAISIYDRSFTSWYGLGYAEFALKRFPDASISLARSVELKGDSMGGQFLLGVTYRALKEYSKAETALLKAIKAAGEDDSDIRWEIALLYANNMQRFGEAADNLEVFLKRNPDAPNRDAVRKLIRQFREKARSSSNK